MKSFFLLFCNVLLINFSSAAQNPALIGYWHNWNDANAPYIALDQVDSRYNIINLSFAVPRAGSDHDMEFTPVQVTQSTLISEIQTLQSQGKKVNISIGGAGVHVSLDNISERDTFIASMNGIINPYGFDGFDNDLEGSSISVTGGTINNPFDQNMIHLTDAIRQIMGNYYTTHNKRLYLSMAPETAFVQGGMSAYTGIWGAYLPLIDALRDSIEILHVQLYNSGSMFGIDGNIYTQGTADFIVAMTEAVIQGFNTTGGNFGGLPANKIAIGLPACQNAAGGGFTDTNIVKTAIDYLRGTGPQPGTYALAQTSAYPDLRGMMTWSVNWDAINTCQNENQFADNFQTIFGMPTNIDVFNESNTILNIFPNPNTGYLNITTSKNAIDRIIQIYNVLGETVYSSKITNESQSIDLTSIPKGIYYIETGNKIQRLIII